MTTIKTRIPRPRASPSIDRPLVALQVRIGSRFLIGEKVATTPSVTISDDAVIICGSVVILDIPARCIAAGNPAGVLKEFDAAAGPRAPVEAVNDHV